MNTTGSTAGLFNKIFRGHKVVHQMLKDRGYKVRDVWLNISKDEMKKKLEKSDAQSVEAN